MNRVRKNNRPGMEHLSANRQRTQAVRTTIPGIPEKGVSDFLQMYTNLMGTTGRDLNLKQRTIWKCLQNTITRQGFFAALFDRLHEVVRSSAR